MIVENVATCPRAVGLLFAGSSTLTVANPISNVLTGFGVSMVGCTSGASQKKGLFRRIAAWLSPAASAAQGLPVDPAAVAEATRVKKQHEQAIMRIEGVVGLGVGASDVAPGEAVVEVYVKKATPAVRAAIPAQLDNVPVKVVETGEITARTDACHLE